jgi:hypothetical protein
LIAGVVLLLQPNEPSYKGKPLGYWLDQLPATIWNAKSGGVAQMYPIAYANSQESQADSERLRQAALQAREAVDALGTNCLRTLVARLGSTDSRVKLFVQRVLVRLGLLKPRGRFVTAELRRGQASTALLRLKSRAKSITPDLLELAKSMDAEVREAALQALWSVDPGEYQRLEEKDQLAKTSQGP